MQLCYADYAVLYGDNPDVQKAFSRYLWDAEKVVNDMTTGVDGICKLKVAFPTDEYAAESVKRAIVAVIDKIYQIDDMNRKLAAGKVAKSKSAGNESISYETGTGEIAKAVSSTAEQSLLYSAIVERYLSGIADANGVNLLYRGLYPYKV